MEIEASLNSPSIREQTRAVVPMQRLGAHAIVYVQLLLNRCQEIDQSNDLSREEEYLLGFGALTIARVIVEFGFSADDPLHASALQWITKLTESPNIQIAGHSVYALGTLATQSPTALQQLCALVNSARRDDDYEKVSLRAVALRLVRRVDTTKASTFVDAPAFIEYARAVNHWIAETNSATSETQKELQDEQDWITNLKK